MKKQSIPTYECDEISQLWYDSNGERIILSVSPGINSYDWDVWNPKTPMTLKKEGHCMNIYRYMPYSDKVYVRSLSPTVKRNGFHYRILLRQRCCNVIKYLLTCSLFETAVKLKRYDIVDHFNPCEKLLLSAARITIKHNYKISNFDMWRDTIEAMIKIGGKYKASITNVKYACPDDLIDMHTSIMKRLSKKQIEERVQRKIDRARQAMEHSREYEEAFYENKDEIEEQYYESKKNFLPIAFEGYGIKVHVLQNVQEFVEEGREMCHCVFTNAYYEKTDKLIMSATDEYGQRLATIDVNLESFCISQCSGYDNDKPALDKMIRKLVNDNMYLIKKASRKSICISYS